MISFGSLGILKEYKYYRGEHPAFLYGTWALCVLFKFLDPLSSRS